MMNISVMFRVFNKKMKNTGRRELMYIFEF